MVTGETVFYLQLSQVSDLSATTNNRVRSHAQHVLIDSTTQHDLTISFIVVLCYSGSQDGLPLGHKVLVIRVLSCGHLLLATQYH